MKRQWDEPVAHGVGTREEPTNRIQHDGVEQIEATNNERNADPGVHPSPSNELLVKHPQEKVTAAPESELSVVHHEDENEYGGERISTYPNDVEDDRNLHFDHGDISPEDDCTVKKDVCMLSLKKLPVLLKCLGRSKNMSSKVKFLFDLAREQNLSLVSQGFDKEHPDHEDLWAARNQLLKLFDGKLSCVSADQHGVTEEQSLRADLINKMIDDPITKKVVSVLQAMEDDEKFKEAAVAKCAKEKERPLKSPKRKGDKKRKLKIEANAGEKRKKVDADDNHRDDVQSGVKTKKAKSIDNA